MLYISMKQIQKMIAINPELKLRFDGQMIARRYKSRTKYLEYLLNKDKDEPNTN